MKMIELNAKLTDDIVVITSYFNSNGYKTKRLNYDRFVDDISASGGTLVTIECVFGDKDFDLPVASNNFRIRTSNVLWQKERLLNIVINALPSSIKKVAWVDCDLIFENKNWLLDASEKLEQFNVIQPFETVVRLPQDCYEDNGDGIRYLGFGAAFSRDPLTLTARGKFTRHGHSGFAWAARREVLKFGLYDCCISGNGDHLMAHAFTGDWETECFRSHFEENHPYWHHFESWCHRIYPLVRSNVSYVPGKVLHLWHGEAEERKYMERNIELNSFSFDPNQDLRTDSNGCFCWNSNKPDLHRWAQRYFGARHEDGRTVKYPTKEMLVDRLDRAQDRAVSEAHFLRLENMKAIVKESQSISDAIAITNSALGINRP